MEMASLAIVSFGALKPTRLGGFGAFGAFPGCQTAGLESEKKVLALLAQWFAHWQWLDPEAYKAWTEWVVFWRAKQQV